VAHDGLKAEIHKQLIHDLDPDQLTSYTGIGSQVRLAVELAAEERIRIAATRRA
jgi:hypothetical protein